MTPIRPIQAGGAQAFLADLARGLAARGHEVQLYCAEGSQVPGVELVMVAVPEEAAEAALVRPGGAPPPAVAALSDAFVVLFAELRRRGADAVSQHAFDVEAIELAAGLNAVHTLHLPPIVPAVVAAVQASLDPVVTVSVAARRAWAAVGVGAGLIPDGVPDFDPGATASSGYAVSYHYCFDVALEREAERSRRWPDCESASWAPSTIAPTASASFPVC